MRKMFILLCVFNYVVAFSQTTARITNLKDAFGSTYTYVGEVKNGKPEGLGMALYPSDNTASYYAGYFVNGLYSGRGYMIFNDSYFLGGDWKNGKLNGKGAYLNKDGGLYVGNYVNGDKHGKGTYFYKDNSFLTGSYAADNFDGRCIYVPASGMTLTDNLYSSGKKNGTGYQYELNEKKLYEGEWSNGDWVKATTASYTSFIKSPAFHSEKTEDQIILGCINRENNNRIHDSAFYYNLKTKKRYFGSYEFGNLKHGIIIKDDSTRFIGTLTTAGAQGQGSFYKIGRFYDEGNYVDDYISGLNSTAIDLAKKTVYYGGMKKGIANGKAFFVDANKTLYSGDYVNSKFTGNGWRLKSDGTFEKGAWKDGYLTTTTTSTTAGSKPMELAPKSFSEAIPLLKTQHTAAFMQITGAMMQEYDTEIVDNGKQIDEIAKGLMALPGALKNYTVTELLEDVYVSFYLKTSDASKAKAKYTELCKEILAAKIVTRAGGTPFNLVGTTLSVPAGNATVISKYNIPGADGEYDFYIFFSKPRVK